MASISKGQKWIGGGLAAAVVIAAAGWFLLISPELSAADDAQAQLADAQTQNIVLQNRLNSLREKASHTADLQTELQDALDSVPPRHDMEGFTRQLLLFAQDASVTVTSITPSAPTLVQLPETVAPSTTAGDSSEVASDAGTGDDAASSDSASDGAAPTTSAAPGAAGNLYSITVTVATTGSMAGQRAFLSAIEKQGQRRALVTSTSLLPIIEADEPDPTIAGSTSSDDGSVDSETAGTSEADTTAAGTTTPTPQAPSDIDGRWTLTTQLMIFVAPQSPDQEAQLLDQLGGNG